MKRTVLALLLAVFMAATLMTVGAAAEGNEAAIGSTEYAKLTEALSNAQKMCIRDRLLCGGDGYGCWIQGRTAEVRGLRLGTARKYERSADGKWALQSSADDRPGGGRDVHGQGELRRESVEAAVLSGDAPDASDSFECALAHERVADGTCGTCRI